MEMKLQIEQMMLEAQADKILAAAGLDRNARATRASNLRQEAFDYHILRYEPTQKEIKETLENGLRRYKQC